MAEIEIVRQSRAKAALLVVGGLVFVAIGVSMLGDEDGSRRYSATEVQVIGVVAILFFAACAILGAIQVVKPSSLRIEPAGLTYEWLWRRRTWAWSDVGPFEIRGAGGARMIRFEAATGARPAIPGGWLKDLESVCAALNAARERWR